MTIAPTRLLVIDDSAYMRKAIRTMLADVPQVEVVGTARNGEDALYQTQTLEPDVVTVDLYMPGMDGLDYIREQMRRKPLPIILISSADADAGKVLAALESGAVGFVQKPTDRALEIMFNMREELVRSIEAVRTIAPDKLRGDGMLFSNGMKPGFLSGPRSSSRFDVLLLGVSTGGPTALRNLLPRFPAYFPIPIGIVLHIPPGYTQAISVKLNEMCELEVVESADGVAMMPGRAVLAKAGFQTTFERNIVGEVQTVLSPGDAQAYYLPSVDQLFESGVGIYGSRVLGVVLTGMGNDGTRGAAWIKSQGGFVIAEAESSCVVYGMPRAVVEAGLADRVVPLEDMARTIMEEL